MTTITVVNTRTGQRVGDGGSVDVQAGDTVSIAVWGGTPNGSASIEQSTGAGGPWSAFSHAGLDGQGIGSATFVVGPGLPSFYVSAVA
jgi:hypothetical protein